MRSYYSLTGPGFQLHGLCSTFRVSRPWSVGTVWEHPPVFVRAGPHHRHHLPKCPEPQIQATLPLQPSDVTTLCWTPAHRQEVFSQPWRSEVFCSSLINSPLDFSLRQCLSHVFEQLPYILSSALWSFMVGRQVWGQSGGPSQLAIQRS